MVSPLKVAYWRMRPGLGLSIGGLPYRDVVHRYIRAAATQGGGRSACHPGRPHTQSGNHSEVGHLAAEFPPTAARPAPSRSGLTPGLRPAKGNLASRRAAPPSVGTPRGCHRAPSPQRGHIPCIKANH